MGYPTSRIRWRRNVHNNLDWAPTIKTGRHEITEILLKVALNTIIPLSNLDFLLRINNINNKEKLIIIRNNINE